MDLQIAPDFFSGNFSFQDLPVYPNQVKRFRPIFTEKLNSEPAQSGCQQRLRTLGTGLGSRVEHRVPATNVRLDGVLGTDSIPELHFVPVAWAATIRVVGALRKKCGKDTMLHMK